MDEHDTLVQWFDRNWQGGCWDCGSSQAQARARMEQADADVAALRDDRSRLLQVLSNTEQKLAAMRLERDKALAELDGALKERDGLREAQAWIQAERAAMRKHWEGWRAERDALRQQSVTPTILQATMEHEPTRLEIAVRLAAGMCAYQGHITSDTVVASTWMLAGRLLAKARGEPTPGAGKEDKP